MRLITIFFICNKQAQALITALVADLYLAVEISPRVVSGLDEHDSIAMNNDEAVLGILKHS